jgi:hypothetical protein
MLTPPVKERLEPQSALEQTLNLTARKPAEDSVRLGISSGAITADSLGPNYYNGSPNFSPVAEFNPAVFFSVLRFSVFFK